MAWHNIERLLQQTAFQSGLSGKFYILLWLCVRMLILLTSISKTFKSELDRFVCDTRFLGCQQMCFNQFSPMSMHRYWELQLICSVTPVIVFVMYAEYVLKDVQKVEDGRAIVRRTVKKRMGVDHRRSARSKNSKNSQNSEKQIFEAKSIDEYSDHGDIKVTDVKEFYGKEIVPFRKEFHTPAKVVTAYWWTLVVKLMLEVLFSVGQYFIYPYHLVMENEYICTDVYPCQDESVTCWPVRPFEKTFMIWMWFIVTIFQVVFGLFELASVSVLSLKEAYKNAEDYTKQYR